MIFKSFCIFFGLFCASKATPLQVLQDPFKVKDDSLAPFIVGGIEAPENYAPHMAAIIIGDGLKMLLCGGSIVSPVYVLTAAHCIEPFIVWGQLLESYRTVVGTNDWFAGGVTTLVKTVHIHPKYDHQTIKYDVGLLRLVGRLRMTDSIGFIGLGRRWIGADESSYVTGWGRLLAWGIVPYRLQLLYLSTISPEHCIQGIHNASLVHGQALMIYPEIEICTFHSVNHGMCNGDSGSALVSIKTNLQIGIVSWGFPCALGAPDVFVRISGVQDWINSIIF